MTTPAGPRKREVSNLVAMVLSALPGAGHYYLDRYLMGALLFGAFVTAVNGIFLGSTLQSSSTHPETLKTVSMVALVLVWLLSVVHTFKQSYGTDRKSLRERRGLLLRSALVDYVRDDLEDSAKKLESAIELDVDWQDPDPLFHLGVVMLRLAEQRAARTLKEGARAARRRSQWAFRTCLTRDKENKWRTEIARESKRMRRLLSSTGRLRQITASSSDRMWAISESGSFPELQASGTFPRLGTSGEQPTIPMTGTTAINPPGAATEAVAAELEAELNAPTPRRALSTEVRKRLVQQALSLAPDAPTPRATPAPRKRRPSSRYLPPPTRNHSRADLALARSDAEKPADGPAEKPADEVAEKPADEVAEKPADEVAEKPADEVAEKPADEVTEKPADEVAEKPVDESAEKPVDESADKYLAPPTEEPLTDQPPTDESAADEPAADEPSRRPIPETEDEDSVTEEASHPGGSA